MILRLDYDVIFHVPTVEGINIDEAHLHQSKASSTLNSKGWKLEPPQLSHKLKAEFRVEVNLAALALSFRARMVSNGKLDVMNLVLSSPRSTERSTQWAGVSRAVCEVLYLLLRI